MPKLKIQLLICFAWVTGWVFPALLLAQTATPYFSVAEDFDTGETFMDEEPVRGMLFLDNDQLLFFGGFRNLDYAPWQEWIRGLGRVNLSGTPDYTFEGGINDVTQADIHLYDSSLIVTSASIFTKFDLISGTEFIIPWGELREIPGTANPYDFLFFHSVYVQEDQKVILCGNVTLDTIPPKENTAMTRLHADGSIDWDFPRFTLGPSSFSDLYFINQIKSIPSGGYYVTGIFESINGHFSPRMARLLDNFQVDTTFTSPFELIYGRELFVDYIDNENRPYVSGRDLIYFRDLIDSNEVIPDTSQLVRLNAVGLIDTLFHPIKLALDSFPPEYNDDIAEGDSRGLVRAVVPIDSSKLLIAGTYYTVNDYVAAAIAVVDTSGNLLPEYFQGDGVDFYFHHPPIFSNHQGYDRPYVRQVVPAGNNEFYVMGRFSSFMGYERHNVVKIKLNTVSTDEVERSATKWQVYPNPAVDQLVILVDNREQAQNTSAKLYDLQGRIVRTFRLDSDLHKEVISDLNSGFYLLELVSNQRSLGSKKVLIQ